MKRSVKKYLSSKPKNERNNLDYILEKYLSGHISKILSKYDGVKVYPNIGKRTVQLNYSYNNIHVGIDFFESNYQVAIYYSGISANELEKIFIAHDYQDDFDLTKLIDNIDIEIKKHPKLEEKTIKDKNRKKYKLIASLSLWMPIIVFTIISLYCVITESIIQLDWWVLFFIIIPIVLWFVFDSKSK